MVKRKVFIRGGVNLVNLTTLPCRRSNEKFNFVFFTNASAAQGIEVESPERSEDLKRKARPRGTRGCAPKILVLIHRHKWGS
jgi:hypothetical protein